MKRDDSLQKIASPRKDFSTKTQAFPPTERRMIDINLLRPEKGGNPQLVKESKESVAEMQPFN